MRRAAAIAARVLARCAAALLGPALIQACAAPPAGPPPGTVLVTAALWAGAPATSTALTPPVAVEGPGRGVRGPFDPAALRAAGAAVAEPDTPVYEERLGEVVRLVAPSQGGATLGRLVERRPGIPERRFVGDVVFPLGHWRAGETRDFAGEEITLAGPAPRRYRLEILSLEPGASGLAARLRFRLAVHDAAGRLLSCSESLWSAGQGRVAHVARGYWDGCTACPCAN